MNIRDVHMLIVGFQENETSCNSLAFQGTMKIHYHKEKHAVSHGSSMVSGNGHHGIDYVGVASVRAGKGIMMGSLHQGQHMMKIV